MSAEAPKTKTPEQSNVSPEAIAQAFATAHHDLQRFTADPRLHAQLKSKGLDFIEDTHKAGYWRVVSDFAQERLNALRASHGNSLRLDTVGLLAATPDFLFANYALDSDMPLSKSQSNHAKKTASLFNRQLQDYATRYPAARPADVTKGLLGIVNTTIVNPKVRQASANMVRRTVHGAQEELRFNQILERTGRPSRPSTTEEDLEGVDRVVKGRFGNELRIDIKSSTAALRDEVGLNGSFAFHNHNIRIASPVRDEAINESFFLPESRAIEEAPRLEAILTAAELGQTATHTALTYSA